LSSCSRRQLRLLLVLLLLPLRARRRQVLAPARLARQTAGALAHCRPCPLEQALQQRLLLLLLLLLLQ
jgi:hypothetical protein